MSDRARELDTANLLLESESFGLAADVLSLRVLSGSLVCWPRVPFPKICWSFFDIELAPFDCILLKCSARKISAGRADGRGAPGVFPELVVAASAADRDIAPKEMAGMFGALIRGTS